MRNATGIAVAEPATDPIYRLLAWLSPSYPIGAFSYSHGIETAVEEGFIKDRPTLVRWLESVLLHGTGAVDGALFAAAWQAATDHDWPAFDAIAERAAAWRGTSEMALESRQQPPHHSAGDLGAQMARGDLLEVMGLVQHQPLVGRQDRGVFPIVLRPPDREVGREEVMVHHHDVGLGRAAPRPEEEAAVEVGTLEPGAQVGLGAHLVPHLR